MSRTLSFTLLSLCLAIIVGAFPAAGDQTPFVPPRTTGSWGWSDCGSPSDAVEIKSLSLSPDPPKPGQNLTVNFAGYVSSTIRKGAVADVSVKLGLIKLLSKRFDICEEAEKTNLSVRCPVEPGDYVVTHTFALPREIPPAKFGVEVRAYNDDEENLACANIKVDFFPRLSPRLKASFD